MTFQFPEYKSHKIVRAGRITQLAQEGDLAMKQQVTLIFGELARQVDGEIEVPTVDVTAEWYVKHGVHTGGYYVIYEDGYTSFSPEEAFVSGYTKVEKIETPDEWYWLDQRWFQGFADTHGGRYNTIRWGSPSISAKLFMDLKHQRNVAPVHKQVWLFGLSVARYFDQIRIKCETEELTGVELELANFWDPEVRKDKLEAGRLGMFMGLPVFADRDARMPVLSVAVGEFKGGTMVGHRLSGITL